MNKRRGDGWYIGDLDTVLQQDTKEGLRKGVGTKTYVENRLKLMALMVPFVNLSDTQMLDIRGFRELIGEASEFVQWLEDERESSSFGCFVRCKPRAEDFRATVEGMLRNQMYWSSLTGTQNRHIYASARPSEEFGRLVGSSFQKHLVELESLVKDEVIVGESFNGEMAGPLWHRLRDFVPPPEKPREENWAHMKPGRQQLLQWYAERRKDSCLGDLRALVWSEELRDRSQIWEIARNSDSDEAAGLLRFLGSWAYNTMIADGLGAGMAVSHYQGYMPPSFRKILLQSLPLKTLPLEVSAPNGDMTNMGKFLLMPLAALPWKKISEIRRHDKFVENVGFLSSQQSSGETVQPAEEFQNLVENAWTDHIGFLRKELVNEAVAKYWGEVGTWRTGVSVAAAYFGVTVAALTMFPAESWATAFTTLSTAAGSLGAGASSKLLVGRLRLTKNIRRGFGMLQKNVLDSLRKSQQGFEDKD